MLLPSAPSPGLPPAPTAALPTAGGTQGSRAKALSPPCLPSALAAGAAKGAAGTIRHFFQQLLPAFPSPSQRPVAVLGSMGGSWGQGEGSAGTSLRALRWPWLFSALEGPAGHGRTLQRRYFTGSAGKVRLASPVSAGASAQENAAPTSPSLPYQSQPAFLVPLGGRLSSPDSPPPSPPNLPLSSLQTTFPWKN